MYQNTNQIEIRARAKINLVLDVTGKREDGYHELRMIMQTLELSDILKIKKVDKPGYVKIVTNLPWLPVDEKNLVYRGIVLLREKYGFKDGIFVELTKNIPVSAGLAGGSSDCAAVLLGIRSLMNLNITDEELMAYGKTLGADVPYCILGGCALAEGIGEKLTILNALPPAHVLVAKPQVIVSTADVFKRFRMDDVKKRPDLEKIIFCIKNSDLKGICNEFCNVLESVTAKEYPIIEDIKKVMVENGAISAIMSGSGPSVFGFYDNKTDMYKCEQKMRGLFPQMKDIFCTQLFQNGGKGYLSN